MLADNGRRRVALGVQMNLFRTLWTALAACLMIGASVSPAVAAHFYVDRALGDVAQRAAMKSPGPVQVLVEFQVNGVRNERGTKQVTKLVMAEIAKLPYLPQVSDKPVASGALLTVKINNIFSEEERKKAMKSAFKSGFTFGASDTIVRDNYTMTFGYTSATGAAPVTSSVRHALITTLGKGSDPTYGTEYKKAIEAISALVGQTLDHGLDEIARKSAA